MFYIFHGDDSHSQKEKLVELRSQLGDPSLLELNTTQFGSSLRFSELRQVCDSIPFLTQRRLVIVRGLLSQKPGRDLIDQLAAYLPEMPDSTRLFFLEPQRLRRDHKLIRLAEEDENGYVRLFERPEGLRLHRWVEQRAIAKGGQISPQATQMLVSEIGNDLAVLDNELKKLVLYRGADETIVAEDVALLCPYVAETSIFELVDAVGNRREREAVTLLHRKLNEGADPSYLFAMIVRQFRLLIQVKALADEGQRPPSIAKELGLHEFVAGKIYQQCQHFTRDQLIRVYGYLLETDVGFKTGRADMATSLDLLVAALV